MRFAHALALAVSSLLLGCQPVTAPSINILDRGQIFSLQTEERVPARLIEKAGLTLNPNDRVLLNGRSVAPDQPIATYPITLQIRRAVPLTVTAGHVAQRLESSAFSIGQALQEASIWLHAGDRIEPDPGSPPSSTPITVYDFQPRYLNITADGMTITLASSAQTVGEALAQAGIPLIGLDYSVPAEKEPLPADGQIRLVRVSESMQLAQKPIPFESKLQASADVPLDQTKILQPGETGLIVQRIRIRYEDGKEVARITEAETMVHPPGTRIMAYGTKIEVKSAAVDGVNLEYWRAVQMYATSYSPCRSGGDKCYSGTSSGKTVQKGIAGLRYDLYLSMRGQQLYIPGYGFASVEDVCNGCVGKPWIDLGFSDNNYEPWHSWVTVYFLTPVPENVVYVLD